MKDLSELFNKSSVGPSLTLDYDSFAEATQTKWLKSLKEDFKKVSADYRTSFLMGGDFDYEEVREEDGEEWAEFEWSAVKNILLK